MRELRGDFDYKFWILLLLPFVIVMVSIPKARAIEIKKLEKIYRNGYQDGYIKGWEADREVYLNGLDELARILKQ